MGYAGIVELPESIFELVLGKCVSDDDDLQRFAEEILDCLTIRLIKMMLLMQLKN